MTEALATIVAVLISFPPVVLIATYYIMKRVHHQKKKAIHQGIELSSVFFLIANVIILQESYHLFELLYLWMGLIFLFILLMVIQWRMVGDIYFRRLIKLYLRSLFLIQFPAYLVLFILSVINPL